MTQQTKVPEESERFLIDWTDERILFHPSQSEAWINNNHRNGQSQTAWR